MVYKLGTARMVSPLGKYISQKKIPSSVKQWKVPGIKCITTVSKENVRKKSGNDHGGSSSTKSSTFS